MMPRLPTILGAAAVAFCVGCGALSAPKAQFPNTVAFPTVYALNGAPPATPSGLNFLSGSPVLLDANLQFNVALDIDSAGRIVVYSARKVTNGLTGVTSVGMQTVGGTFDGYTEATKNGYVVDSSLVVSVGQVVAFNVHDQTTCTVYSLGSSYFGKFVVDSINPAQRAIYVELLSNPNCGYVTLTPGIPKK